MRKKISCIAVDDEPMALLVIENFCSRKGGISLKTFSEPHSGLKAIMEEKPDVVFLDIRMDGTDGIEIAKTLPAECCLIFTTAHAQYALDGFNLDAVDFLHKPFAYSRFAEAVDRAVRRMSSREASSPSAEKEKSIVVKQEYSNVSIRLSDIVYIEALGNYVKIIRTDGTHVLTRSNMKAMQGALPPEQFVRIHRSYMVAKDKVGSFSHTQICLADGNTVLPIGQQYASLLADELKGIRL